MQLNIKMLHNLKFLFDESLLMTVLRKGCYAGSMFGSGEQVLLYVCIRF